MQRTFLSNLSLLMLLNLLVKPAYLLLVEAEVQNRVGSEVFGHYSALLSLGFLLNIFLDLGINTFTSRELPRRSIEAGDYLSGVVLLRLVLALLYFVLLAILGFTLNYSFESLLLLGWIGVNQLLAASILYIRSNLSGLLLFKRDAVLSILDRALLTVALALVLYGGFVSADFDIRWLIGAQSAAYFLALFVGVLFLGKHTGRFKLKWRPKLNRIVLNQSIPYALLVLLMMVYYKTDSVMLERMHEDGAWQAGVYAMGYRLFEAANMIGYLFATLLLPLFSKTLKAGKSPEKLVSNAFRIVITGSGTLALLCALWPREILDLIYDNDIDSTIAPFKALMTAFVFMMLSYVWGTLLTAGGKMRSMNVIAAIAVLLNIVLNLILIPSHGAFGSAAASLATQILVAVAQMILVYRFMSITPGMATWLRILAFLGLTAGCGVALQSTSLPFIAQLLIFVVVSFAAAFLLKLIKVLHLKDLLNQDE